MPQGDGGFRAARGILKNTSGEAPEVTIRRMRDNDVLGMGVMLEAIPQPRALVALSEDRQWLCALAPTGVGFVVCEWHAGDAHRVGGWIRPILAAEDTGQSAEDVLREWLEGRGG